ncbi:helicase-related protein [Streptomyces sp. MS19]|uniref:helicase-related protein n=1 Tax=Streptomyces sp. MS19 TaxID=3385972 RepID=UPI00399F37F6
MLGVQNQRDQRLALSERIAEHLGEEHELTVMVTQGIAYHHGTVPQPVRHLLEDAHHDGALRVLCATSTLSQGMNLPVKTVLVHSAWRNQEQIGVREFWNAAGRAFQETEGHVVLIAKDAEDARKLRRRYLDKDNIESVLSTIGALYHRLATTRLGARPTPGQNLTDIELPDPELEELTDWAQALDLQLLTMLAEEVIDTLDQQLLEDAAHDLLTHTLGGHQIGAQEWSLKPLARFTARRVATLARQLPDPAAHAAILRTGLSLQGGLDAITAAEQLANTLTEHPSLLDPATWPALRDTVLTAATKIHELHCSATAKDRPIGAVVPLAGDWIAGWTLQEIHSHYQLLLDAKDITVTSDYIDKVIVQDAGLGRLLDPADPGDPPRHHTRRPPRHPARHAQVRRRHRPRLLRRQPGHPPAQRSNRPGRTLPCTRAVLLRLHRLARRPDHRRDHRHRGDQLPPGWGSRTRWRPAQSVTWACA